MDNKEMKLKARKIFEMLGLKKVKGYYITNWGKKTEEGIIASIFNILAETIKEV